MWYKKILTRVIMVDGSILIQMISLRMISW